MSVIEPDAVYSATTLTSDMVPVTAVREFISASEEEVSRMTGLSYTPTVINDELHVFFPRNLVPVVSSGFPSTATIAGIPGAILVADGSHLLTAKRPIVGVTSIVLKDHAGNVIKTFLPTDNPPSFLVIQPNRIQFFNHVLQPFPNRYFVTYVHGKMDADPLVKRAVTVIAGMRTVLSLMGGTWRSAYTFTVGPYNANAPLPYTTLEAVLKNLTAERDRILPYIGQYGQTEIDVV